MVITDWGMGYTDFDFYVDDEDDEDDEDDVDEDVVNLQEAKNETNTRV